jgi:hypothetical protein
MSKKRFLISGLVVVVLAIVVLGIILIDHRSNTPNVVVVATSTPRTNQTSTSVGSTPPAISPANSYAINLPNSLMLVDSQGRRTGKDPITDTFYHEIPGTSYSEEGSSGQLYFFTPPTGEYTLYVLGGETGQYHLDIWVDPGNSGPPAPQRISGSIQRGFMVAYTQHYDAADIPGSTFSVSSSASSTASITSVPPNNLPPPPVP